jgi:hypothetical protein
LPGQAEALDRQRLPQRAGQRPGVGGAEDPSEDRDDQVPEGVAALYSCKSGQKSYYDPADSKSKGRERSRFFHHGKADDDTTTL